MLRSYQSIYVMVYRWSFKNFGQGKTPKFKSLFNVSFLLVIMLTMAMLATDLIIKFNLIKLTSYMAMVIMFGEVFLLLINYFVLLNNRWFNKMNERMYMISKHNQNKWSLVLLVNVIIICGIFIFTI